MAPHARGAHDHGSSPAPANVSSATKAAAPPPEQTAINTVWKACAYGEFDRLRDFVDADPTVVHQVLVYWSGPRRILPLTHVHTIWPDHLPLTRACHHSC